MNYLCVYVYIYIHISIYVTLYMYNMPAKIEELRNQEQHVTTPTFRSDCNVSVQQMGPRCQQTSCTT